MSLPFEGLKVLYLSRLLPGGFCSLLLADFGADVIKVEDTGMGDYIRWSPPAFEGAEETAKSALFLSLNRGKRSVRIDLPRFTLIGATTRQGLLTTPLRDRFGIPIRLNFYTVEELEQVVRRAAGLLGVQLTGDGSHEIARRSRGTPRIAGRLLRRVRDFAHAAGSDSIDAEVADRALSRLEIDAQSLALFGF